MKRTISLLLAALMLLSLCACGKEETTEPDEVTGEVYDAGCVSALAPEGWKAFPVPDLFDNYEGDNDPTAMQIGKGAKEGWDLFSVPYVQINYYGPDVSYAEPMRDYYDETEDIEPMTLGNYTWTGFNVISEDAPLSILWTEDGDVRMQITVSLCTGKNAVTLADPEVQAIIASITVTE